MRWRPAEGREVESFRKLLEARRGLDRQRGADPGQHRFMRKGRRLRPKRLEHLELNRTVRHMVLAADNLGDAEVDVVDHARKQIEPATVLAPDDGIAEQ